MQDEGIVQGWYDTTENPDILSLMMIDKSSKRVDYFREGISSY